MSLLGECAGRAAHGAHNSRALPPGGGSVSSSGPVVGVHVYLRGPSFERGGGGGGAIVPHVDFNKCYLSLFYVYLFLCHILNFMDWPAQIYIYIAVHACVTKVYFCACLCLCH